ncbi:DNA type IV secretion system protein ComB10 [Campylobacter corcagiensis]|uniref:DNA type IV secretion system protein ComB10 n=1 Tax=Campylobacter corcagiensis TaxID=1448857 RepID=A0A7M1LDM9_9BACT|nr:DNA type IV secretion system protein ComB10 [Campylobacter corcagiensis]QKF65191.1 P-type type IV conjugative transfer system translocation pore protein TrbI/VirB10 [Campylobacter corcagiensis]QOQ86667.1 DNA type IV secretion system protein ComB10 [Campylobacter corcagiensis]
MKKGKNWLFFSIFILLSLPLFAEELSDEQIRNLQNEKDLNHLFENSKFPVDDYIYKAGKRKPNQESQDLTKILKQKADELPQAAKSVEQIANEQEQMAQRAKEKEEELIEKQANLKQSMQIDSQTAYENKMRRLLRAQILANRNNEIKNADQASSKYGVDGFSNQQSIDISTNEHRLYRTIRAGRMIPAILTTAISSDLSGIVTAQIEQDIYATMGRAVLIPRGSKAIGFYENNTEIGHERLEIRWREIITPQGVNILLTDALVADNMGMTGAIGAVNNKYWERYGIPYTISTLTNALLLVIASKVDKGGSSYTQEIYSDSRSDIGTVVQDMIQQQSKIKPTIEIQSGSRVFLVPTNHMWFSKPKNGEVLMKYFEE